MKSYSVPVLRQQISLETLIISVVGAGIILFLLKVILWRLLGHLIDISLGFCLAVTLALAYMYNHTDNVYDEAKLKVRKPLGNRKGYKFTQDIAWKKELEKLAGEKPGKSAIFSESFLVSDAMELLLEYVSRDFVLAWYERAFKDESFPILVDNAIRESIAELGDRAKRVEWADLVVRKVVPLLTDHFNNYVNAVRIVREKSTERQMVQSSELDIAVAERYGKLHDAVMLTHTGYEETHRRNWLRGKVLSFLPFLLNEDDMGSSVVSGLIKDIVACSILHPVISMISNPDFINETITKAASSTLRDREKVEKLREALDAHSSLPRTNNSGRKRAVSGLQRNLKLSPNADRFAYEKFLKDIQKCESVPDARQTRFYISVQIQRAAKQGGNTLYETRLKEAKQVIDMRIAYLTDRRPDIADNSPMRVSSHGSSVADIHGIDYRYNYTLNDILNDAVCSSFLMEYMDQRRKTVLVQFLLAVNILRDPMARGFDEELDDNTDPLGGLQVAKNGKEEQSDHVGKQDMRQIYVQYFSDESNKIGYSREAHEALAAYFQADEEATFQQYRAAHTAILKTQNEVYKRLEEGYAKKFKESDLFMKYLATAPLTQQPLTLDSSIDRLQMDQMDDNDSDYAADTEAPAILSRSDYDIAEGLTKQSDVTEESNLLAVEKALNDIMSLDTKSDVNLSPYSNTKVQSSVAKSPTLILPKRQSKLFDDSDDDDSDMSTQEINLASNSESKTDSLRVRLAAPGDLTLTEAIKVLTATIDQLYQQERILDQMISKAELTNNTAELRILYKSRTSLEREVQLKEQQRQQYIVQESENSLYGRSDVRIESYVTSMDANGPYTLYIIEVRKFDNDGNITGGWIVGRRYNQFFQLHQHLRLDYAEVGKISFPKKRVVLKFQPKTFVDARRAALEKYMKELLRSPDLCKSKALRLFLSSDTFSLDSVQKEGGDYYDSEDSASIISTRPTASRTESTMLASSNTGLEILPILASDTDDNESNRPFVQPICDFFIQIFGFSTKENWLKGRAVVVILQQLLGGRIEKKARDIVSDLTSESKIVQYIRIVRDSAWPNGKRKSGPGPVRTLDEKQMSQREADLLLLQLFDSAGKVVGRSSSRYASKHLFGMCQNEILNLHLVFRILDIIFDELFPELTGGQK